MASASKNNSSSETGEVREQAPLRSRFRGGRVAVCLEQSRGPLIYALLKYDFLTLYPVNPKTLAKFREAFSPSRAKDDPTDAEYLVELLLHHRARLRAWLPDDEKTRELRLLVEHRRRLVSDQTRTSNRLTSLLKGYFPQVLEWFPEVGTALVCDFLLRWPSLGALKGVRRSTLEGFFRRHNSRRRDLLDGRLEAIKRATPLTTDAAVINSSVLLARSLASQMKATLAAVREFDRRIDELCRAHEDFELFASFPGAGPVYASRLLSAAGAVADGGGTLTPLGCRARGRVQRAEPVGEVALLLPEVPAPELRRVRRRERQTLAVGACLL